MLLLRLLPAGTESKIITFVHVKSRRNCDGARPSHHSAGARFPERVAARGHSHQERVFSCVLQAVLLQLCSRLGHLRTHAHTHTHVRS